MAIYHIVLVKYNTDATAEQRAAWVAGINGLQDAIPQLKEVKSGKKIANAADGGWDNGAIGIFDSIEDVRAYASSEPHLKFINDVKSFVADKIVFDIEV